VSKRKGPFFLQSERVALRAVGQNCWGSNDFGCLTRWLNDPVATHFLFYGQTPKNQEQVRAMIMAQVEAPHNVVLMVCDLKATSDRPIGFAGLYDIHLTARKAEFRIFIGEALYRGKGIGTEVTELLTFYGFDRLNLHRIWLGVTSENKGGVRAYEKAGYTLEGVLRDDIYRNSRYYDSVRMAILRPEYYEKLFEAHKQRFAPEPPAKK